MHKGVQELHDYREKGRKLTRKEAMLAFCADCMNEYSDGKIDCNNPRCPMHAFMPYNRSENTEE